MLTSGKWKRFFEDHNQCLSEYGEGQRSLCVFWWVSSFCRTQISYCKIKGLNIKRLVARTQEGLQENSCTNPGTFLFVS